MGHAFRAVAEWLAGHEANIREAEARVAPEKETILVIDDEPDFLASVATWLRMEGFDVLAASSGCKGVNMLQYAVHDIHVVLLDYRMPDLDGAETLRYLRRLNPHVKVIAVTGVEPESIPESFRSGTDCFVRKPFRQQDLLTAIRSVTPSPTVAAVTSRAGRQAAR